MVLQSLVFKHALSQIVFKGKAGTTMAVRIKSIKVHNLKRAVSLLFPMVQPDPRLKQDLDA